MFKKVLRVDCVFPLLPRLFVVCLYAVCVYLKRNLLTVCVYLKRNLYTVCVTSKT